MPIQATVDAVEKSTYVVNFSFLDENNNPTTPVSVVWSLTDMQGNVINSRSKVFTPPYQTVTVVLSGNDLEILSGNDLGQRALTVEATYNSTLGAGLYLKEELDFKVVNLVEVT
jgi:hypothetical protein